MRPHHRFISPNGAKADRPVARRNIARIIRVSTVNLLANRTSSIYLYRNVATPLMEDPNFSVQGVIVAKSKAELQHNRDRYYAYLQEALIAREDGRYRAAIAAAESSWEHIDGMMQFERKYERKEDSNKEHGSIETIDIVLKLAPLLFESSSLSKLDELLRNQRKIDRNSSDDIKAKHEAAVSRMWMLRAIWAHLEREGESESEALKQRLNANSTAWEDAIEEWESLGVVQRRVNPSRLQLTTRMQSIGCGKCPVCGVRVKGTKSKLLEVLTCPKCKSSVRFVLVVPSQSAAKE